MRARGWRRRDALAAASCAALVLVVGCCSQESVARAQRQGNSVLRLPREAGAKPLLARERSIDTDRNGLAEALELAMRVPTSTGRAAFAFIEVFGQERGGLRSITYATTAGNDVWRLAGPSVSVPLCSDCQGIDSLIVRVDGERIRRRGIDGPYVVMVEVWEGSADDPGTTMRGRYEYVTARYAASRFGWLPARLIDAALDSPDGDSTVVIARVLVEGVAKLVVRGDLYEGDTLHSTAVGSVPKGMGVHQVRLAFYRTRSDSGAVAAPVAKVWLSAVDGRWPESNLWDELWQVERRDVSVGKE